MNYVDCNDYSVILNIQLKSLEYNFEQNQYSVKLCMKYKQRDSFWDTHTSQNKERSNNQFWTKIQKSPISLGLSHKNLLQKIQSIGKRQKINNQQNSQYLLKKEQINKHKQSKEKQKQKINPLYYNIQNKISKGRIFTLNEYMMKNKKSSQSKNKQQKIERSKNIKQILNKIQKLKQKSPKSNQNIRYKSIKNQNKSDCSINNHLQPFLKQKITIIFIRFIEVQKYKMIKCLVNKLKSIHKLINTLNYVNYKFYKLKFIRKLKNNKKIFLIKNKLSNLIQKLINKHVLIIYNQFKCSYLKSKGIANLLIILNKIIYKIKQNSFLVIMSTHIQKSIVDTLHIDTMYFDNESQSKMNISNQNISLNTYSMYKNSAFLQNQINNFQTQKIIQAPNKLSFQKHRHFIEPINQSKYKILLRLLSKKHKLNLMRSFYRFQVQLCKINPT